MTLDTYETTAVIGECSFRLRYWHAIPDEIQVQGVWLLCGDYEPEITDYVYAVGKYGYIHPELASAIDEAAMDDLAQRKKEARDVATDLKIHEGR